MYNGKHNSNTINHLQQAQPVQNEWECSTRLSVDLFAVLGCHCQKYSNHIGHPYCLPLVNHSCSKIKLKGERSCMRLYNSKAIKYMHLSSVPGSA